MTAWPRSEFDYITVRSSEIPSWNNGSICPIHPSEHVLFIDEVAVALRLKTEQVGKLISEGKLERGVFISKGYGWQPYFVSLLNLVEFEVCRILKKRLAPHHYSKRLVDEFLSEISEWFDECENCEPPVEMQKLLMWIYSLSLNAARGLGDLKAFGEKQSSSLILSAFHEWASLPA
ncbi:hypothetical protein [Shimia sediminis]|uniref:hypothetical protein n=1 Tax=Shimia sediminis TaxID=2497945 RepID=UPI000F8E023F|nr:hypothetical protein [Shimia sediminis]